MMSQGWASEKSERSLRRAFLSAVLSVQSLTMVGVAGISVGFDVPSAQASAEMDRKYTLGNIGILQAWDNIDGLFGDIVTQSYKRALKDNSRFVVQDLKKANEVLATSKVPYQKLIEDPEVLGQIAKNYKLDSLLRTRVHKEGPLYRFVIDWIHGPTLDVIATETFQQDEPFGDQGMSGSEEFQRALGEALVRMVKKVPMFGTVTGRDQTAVTVNIGSSTGLKRGDTLVLGTLEEVKKHPLLKQIVEWRMASTGRAVVDEVEEGMAFAKIEAEEYGRQIARFQKVVQIIPRQGGDPLDVSNTVTDLEERRRQAEEPPRLGWIGPGLMLGSHSRESSNATTGFTGNGLALGFKVDGQLWMTSQWFTEMNFAYTTASYTQDVIATGQPSGSASVNASMRQFRLGGGYNYHLTENYFGPRIWGKVAFQSTAFALPTSVAQLTSKASHSGLTFGVGGDMPIRNDFGATMSIDVGVLGGGSESGKFLGTQTGATSVDFFIAGYTWLQPKMKLRVGLDFKSYGLEFANGGSVSNKFIAVGPSLLFYF